MKRTKFAYTISLYGNPQLIDDIKETAQRDRLSLSKRVIEIFEAYLEADKEKQENV